jgi:hypothetical protein
MQVLKELFLYSPVLGKPNHSVDSKSLPGIDLAFQNRQTLFAYTSMTRFFSLNSE